MFEITHPWFFVLAPFFLALVWIWYREGYKYAEVKFSNTRAFKNIYSPAFEIFKKGMLLLKSSVVVLMVLGLVGMRWGLEETKIHKEGIDIILAVDVSTSMLAEDFQKNKKRVNRLEIAKSVIKDFIRERADDRIGIVVFAGRAYTLCPLTLDHDVTNTFLDRAEVGLIEDGTAIGSGLISSIRRLKDKKGESQIIVLLTDGINNAGEVEPRKAAKIAKSLGIKVYTIGTGSMGPVPYPTRDPWGRTRYQNVIFELNEESLREIAAITGGQYFRATNTKELQNIYDEIDKMEKSKVEQNAFYNYRELYVLPISAALVLMLLENILRATRFRTVP